MSADAAPPGTVERAEAPALGGQGWLLLALLTLAGAGLRLVGLDAEPLWQDEATTAAFAARPLGEAATAEVHHPPLYYVLTHLALAAAPEPAPSTVPGLAADVVRGAAASNALVRLPALLAGILLIPALALLVRRLAPGAHARVAALLAALLAALAPFAVYLSQEARDYTLYMLLAVVSTTLVLPLLGAAPVAAPGGRRGRLALYALTSLLLMLTHHLGAFVLLAHEALFWVRWRAARRAGLVPAVSARAWLVARVLAAAAFLPWAGFVLRQVSSGAAQLEARHWVGAPQERIPYSVLRHLLGYGVSPEDADAAALPRAELLARELPRALLLLAPLLVLLASGFRARAWRSPGGRRLVVLLLLLPYAVLLPLSPWVKMIHERYLAPQAPLLLAVLALGLAALGGGRRTLGLVLVLGPLLLGLAAQQPGLRGALGLPGAYGKEAWDPAAQFVRQQAPAHVVLAAGHVHLPFDRAWVRAGGAHGPQPVRWAWPARSGGPDGRDGDALPAPAPGERVAVVISHLADEEPRLRALLSAYSVVSERWWPAQSGVRVLILEARR